MFQSTHPHGVRRFLALLLSFRFVVSIHAPAWGATIIYLFIICNFFSFNPRTRMGCDPIFLKMMAK